MLKYSILLILVATAHANVYYGYVKGAQNVAVQIPSNIQTTPPVPDVPVVTDAPVTDAPVTDAPVTDAPVTDAPVTDAPVTDYPATNAPTNAFEAHELVFRETKNAGNVPINPEWQTIVLVHGHEGDLNSASNQMVKREILDNRDANVIIVDWSSFSKLSYSNAVSAVPIVGQLLGSFLVRLEDLGWIQFNTTHLVGFNLGAHAVGIAGRSILQLAGVSPARITGLDPSKSQWGSNSPRLRKTDAAYVEVIHTDGDGLFSNGIGTAIGDVDFFVNGGGNQPGCLTHACCHNRAFEIFAGTFSRPSPLLGNYCATNAQLTLNKCTSQTLHVGDDTLDKSRMDGVYRVKTGRTYPY